MTITKHELRQGRISLLVWTFSIGFLLSVCVFLFPEMRAQVDEISKIFSSMGSFAAAFGMDRLGFGTFIGYYALECGNVLGLGGAFYASMSGVSILSKEEKDRTAEFLLTHPVSRTRVITEKLVAVFVQIISMNIMVYGFSVLSIFVIGENIPWRELNLLHLAYLILQLELTSICFGISAFIRKGGFSVGIGIAVVMYILNLIANVAKSVEYLKYITPYGYCNGADIVHYGRIDAKMLAIGFAFSIAGISAAYWKYKGKDIQ